MSSYSLADNRARPETRIQVDRETWEGKENFTVMVVQEDNIQLILNATSETHAMELAHELASTLTTNTDRAYVMCHGWSGEWG